MDQALVPVIEKLYIRPQTVELRAEMNLAGIAVRVKGQYNIDSNCYYPSVIGLQSDESYDYIDLEEFYEVYGWDHIDTYEAIQEAVEKRKF